MNPKGILERLATLSLERCLVKISKVSAGTWQLLDTSVSRGTMAAAVGQYDFKNKSAAAVYVDVKGGIPLTSMLVFDPEDMDCISKCFLGYSFPRSRNVSLSEEVMLLELGNIMLNSLCNSVMNAMRSSFMPSVPCYIEGDAARITGALGAVADMKKNFRTIAVTLGMESGSSTGRCKVFLLLSEELAVQLEAIVS